MRRVGLATFAILIASLACGCTTTVKTHTPAAGISPGYSYHLPLLSYDVEIKRVLTDCPDAADARLRFEVTASATSRLVQGETIVIDYLAMSNGMKTSDLVFKSHPNGMLKSINFTVNDQTADVIKEATQAVTSIGKIAIGGPLGGAVAGQAKTPRPLLRCIDPIREKVNGLGKLRAAVKTAEDKSKKATKEYSDYEADHRESPRTAAVAANAARLAGLARVAAAELDAAKKAVSDAIDSATLISRLNMLLPAAGVAVENGVANARDAKPRAHALLELFIPVSAGKTIQIPLTEQLDPNYAEADFTGFNEGEVQQMQAWLREPPQERMIGGLLAQLRQATVTIVALPLGSGASIPLPASEGCATDANACGIVYRTPAPGRFRICWVADEGAITPESCASRLSTDKVVLFSDERPVPQFGKLMALPFRNDAFENTVLTAEFAEDGRIVEFGYKRPKAAVQGALAGINTGLGGLTDLIAFERGKELRVLQERKALNDALLAEQESRKKLTPTETALIEEQTRLINAQIALNQALSNAQPSQVTAVNNQTSLIEAEIRQMQRLIELEKAKREYRALTETEEPDDD